MVADLRGLMTDCCGVIRSESGLRRALGDLALMSRRALPEPMLNMVAAATLIAAAALLRCESRGGHFRADHPQPDPTLARRSRLTLAEAEALRDEKVPA
jgi:L-aspartate oxidase